MAHNELLHDAIEIEGADGEVTRACPLYPGLTCRDHLNVAVDIDNARGEGLVQVPFVALCPNTWWVLPTDEVVAVAEKDQFRPAAIQKQAAAVQKTLGEALPRAILDEVRPPLEAAEKAAEEEEWTLVLTSLAALEKTVPAPHASLKRLLATPLETVEEMVRFDADDLIGIDAPTPDQVAAARTLLAQVDVAVYGSYVPIRADLRAWLEKHEAR